MKVRYIGTCDMVDVPDLGIFRWKQGEEKELPDEVAQKLLLLPIYEEVKETKKRGDK